LTVHNDGTRPVENIRFHADVPSDWTTAISPDLIQTLSPGKEQLISARLTPPPKISVGDYEAIIRTDAFAGNKQIDADNKNIRIHVKANGNAFEATLPIMLILAVLVGVVMFGIKLTRR